MSVMESRTDSQRLHRHFSVHPEQISARHQGVDRRASVRIRRPKIRPYALCHNQKCSEIAGHYFIALNSQIVSSDSTYRSWVRGAPCDGAFNEVKKPVARGSSPQMD